MRGTAKKVIVGAAACCVSVLIAVPAAAAPTAPATGVDAPAPSGATAGGLVQPTTADPSALVGLANAPRQGAAGGGDGYAEIGNCSFYASNSMTGAVCTERYGFGRDPISFKKWVWQHRHEKHPEFWKCKYIPPPKGMHPTRRPGQHLMLKICASDIDENRPWGGIHVKFRMYKVWIDNGFDWHTPGWQETFWRVQSRRHPYPIPRIQSGPTYPALVGTYTYFWARWVEAINTTTPAKPDLTYGPYWTGGRYGEVYIHSRVTDLVLHPGRDLPKRHCGRAMKPFDYNAPDAIPRSEGGSQPSKCYVTYEHSSATGRVRMVKIAATVHWRVTIEDAEGNVIQPLGNFQFSVYQGLPVAEVQTEVRTDGW